MGRIANYPHTVDDLRNFDISFLSKHEYLKPNFWKKGAIIWTSTNGNQNSISIQTETNDADGVLILDYTFRDETKINYRVKLITRPSNLGTGLLWYFVCPFTGKVCRKLHLINGYFRHRTAAPRLMYEKQIQSKKWRSWDKLYCDAMDDEVYRELYKKYFKTHYNGKPTKRYVRLMQKLEKQKEFDEIEFYKTFLKR